MICHVFIPFENVARRFLLHRLGDHRRSTGSTLTVSNFDQTEIWSMERNQSRIQRGSSPYTRIACPLHAHRSRRSSKPQAASGEIHNMAMSFKYIVGTVYAA